MNTNVFKKWFRSKKIATRLNQKIAISLDQLIYDIAEFRREEDLEEFCSRVSAEHFYLSLDQPLPASFPGQQIVTGNELKPQTSYAEIAGKRFFMLFTSATHPDLGPTYVEIAGAEALRVTLESEDVHGALFQNSHESWVALDKEKIAHTIALAPQQTPRTIAPARKIVAFGGSLSAALGIDPLKLNRDHDLVTVPPDHKVVTYGASPLASLHRAESGFWILNFGDGRDGLAAIDAIEHFVPTTDESNVIWILQSAFLELLPNKDEFIRRVQNVAYQTRTGVSHNAIFSISSDTTIMQAFKLAGIPTYFATPDGCCFVEVHRPDAIAVGIPGTRF